MAKWSTSIFTWETQAKDSCSTEHHCACFMLSAGLAMLQWIWRAKQTWQSNRAAFWRTQSILKPGTLSVSSRRFLQHSASLIRKPGHCISFSVFIYRSSKHPEDGVSDMHLSVYISDWHAFAASESELPEYRCSLLQDFPQLFPTSAIQPLHPWRDLHLYMLNAGCLATTSLLNLQMVCWQYPGGSAVRGEGLPHPQYYDVMYISHTVC